MACPPAIPRVPMASARTRSISSPRTGGNARRPVRQHFKGARLQCIADEDRGGFVERTMARGSAAAQIVVVHRGQIVVHQAVDVNELDCRRRRIEHLERRTERFAGGIHQYRTHSLAAGQRAVAHGFEQARCRSAIDLERVRQHAFDALLIQRNTVSQKTRRRRAREFSARRHRRHLRQSAKDSIDSSPLRVNNTSTFCCAVRSAVWHWRVSATPRSKVLRASSRGTSPCSSFATRASSSASDCSKSGDLSVVWGSVFWGLVFTRATLNACAREGQTIDGPD